MGKNSNKPDVLDPAIKKFFGDKVKKKREYLDSEEEGEWTREKVGNMIGVTDATIGNIERGVNFPGPARLIKLAAVLDLSLDKVLPRRLVLPRQELIVRRNTPPGEPAEEKEVL